MYSTVALYDGNNYQRSWKLLYHWKYDSLIGPLFRKCVLNLRMIINSNRCIYGVYIVGMKFSFSSS